MSKQHDEIAATEAPRGASPRPIDPDVLYQRWRDVSRKRDEQVVAVAAIAAGPERDAAQQRLDDLKLLVNVANQAYQDRIARPARAAAIAQRVASNSGRREPTFDVDIPLDFENMEDVLQLTRRVARDNFQRHLLAAIDAQGDDAQKAAGVELGRAIKAAQLADKAFRSFMASESVFNVSASEDVLGRSIPSADGGILLSPGYEASARQMEDAADKVKLFADYAPTSAFFQAALTAVVKTDRAFAKAESAASAKVDGFVKGLKAFAQRMSEFSAQVAAVPEKTRELAVRTSVSTKDAAKTVIGRLMTRVRGAASDIAASIEAQVEFGVAGAKAVHADVKASAWALLDDAADFADRNKDRVAAVASKVDTHARVVVAGAGLAGGLLASMGRKVAAGYTEQLERVETTKAARRATPR